MSRKALEQMCCLYKMKPRISVRFYYEAVFLLICRFILGINILHGEIHV